MFFCGVMVTQCHKMFFFSFFFGFLFECAAVSVSPSKTLCLTYKKSPVVSCHLGHANTRAFLSHGGLNSIYEAMYHGVPVVGVPLFGDHYDTMTRVAAKGMGIMLHWKYMTEEDLFTALSSVITDTRLVCLVLLCVLLLLSVRSDKRVLGFSLPKT